MDKKTTERLALAMGAVQFGFLVAGGFLGGLWIDSKLETMPLFGFVGLVIGFTTAIFIILRIQKEIKKDDA